MAERSEFTYSLIDPKIYEIVVARPEIFTATQLKDLESILQGKSNKEIANERNVTERTIKNQIAKMMNDTNLMGLFPVDEKKKEKRTRNLMIWNFLESGVLELRPLKKEDEC